MHARTRCMHVMMSLFFCCAVSFAVSFDCDSLIDTYMRDCLLLALSAYACSVLDMARTSIAKVPSSGVCIDRQDWIGSVTHPPTASSLPTHQT